MTGFFVYFETMKRIIFIALGVIVIAAGVAAWVFLGPATGFNGDKEYLYIRSNAATKEAVLDSLKEKQIITNTTAFNFIANRLDYWTKIKPGKYEIKKGMSIVNIVRMLRNGKQSPVKLVITKFRTKEDFARFTGNRFEFDSSAMINFLNNADSLKHFSADTTTAMWNILPETYTFFWNTTPQAVYKKIAEESKKFWNEDRRRKAEAEGLTPEQAYTLASIIEEETNNKKDKDTIASVYINRISKGMLLAADPTLKFALRDFSIKWIHGDMLKVKSPFNTYIHKGLPPGPICTPSKKTIDAVLNAPATNYLFFVANSDFSGTSLFSATFEEHQAKAKAYQEEDKKRREQKENKAPQ